MKARVFCPVLSVALLMVILGLFLRGGYADGPRHSGGRRRDRV